MRRKCFFSPFGLASSFFRIEVLFPSNRHPPLSRKMSTSNQPQAAALRQRVASTETNASGSRSEKEKAGGNGGGDANPSLSSVFDLDPAPPLRPRPLSKILSGYLTLAVVFSFSLYFAVTVGLSMLLADLRKKRGRGSSGSSSGSSSSLRPPPRLPDPETNREAAVATEPGIEGIDVSHEFIEVPVYPDEAENSETTTKTTARTAMTTTTLHLARAGADPSRRCVLFLHGFPECWLSWRRVMRPLVEAGYEVAALDMRGYNLSGKPGKEEKNARRSLSRFLPPSSRALAAFDVGALAADARAAAVYLSGSNKRTVTLVSHDWGGAVAWHAASVDSGAVRGGEEGKEKRRRLFDALVTMAIPHPLLFQSNMGWEQMKKSWYVAFFQSPFFPEEMMAGDGAASIRAMLPKGSSTEIEKLKMKKEADEIADAFTRPGAATAAVNYYRASVRAVGTGPLSRAGARAARSLRDGVDVPVLSLYARRDSALGVELLAGTERFCHAGVEIEILDSGHWIQLERAKECAERTLQFLERTGGNVAKISPRAA